MRKPTIWTSLKKLSSAAMALITLLLLCSAGYFYVKKEIGNTIPDGTYRLANPRPSNAADFNLSGANFGSVIIVNGREAITNLSPNISYPIKSIGEHNYEIGPALTDCHYKNGQLIFNCQNTFIIYKLQIKHQ